MNYPEDYINKIICGDCLEIMKEIPGGGCEDCQRFWSLKSLIESILKSEKEKSYKDGLERAYEIICGYPEANVMQPRLDIKEEIKRT